MVKKKTIGKTVEKKPELEQVSFGATVKASVGKDGLLRLTPQLSPEQLDLLEQAEFAVDIGTMTFNLNVPAQEKSEGE